MRSHLDNVLIRFLKQYCKDRSPMLLGLSGGPDSMALFHLLSLHHYPFEVAHLDHGWREESEQEAHDLADMCHKRKISFHTQRLTVMDKNRKNLEEEGRNARHLFFKNIMEKRGLKGVFLAHHADDQAETVLKRLFEGATLPKLKGISPVKQIKGITLLRPLLKVRKQEILNWLDMHKIVYFQDITNHNPLFLRSRLRDQLLPALSDCFGKQVSSGLCQIGESAAELSDFLEELMTPYLKQIEAVEEGKQIDFTHHRPPHTYLWKAVVARFFHVEQINISRATIEAITDHLIRGSCHKSLIVGKYKVTIDRNKLLLTSCCNRHNREWGDSGA